MLNIVINMCIKFHHGRLRNDGALGDRKSDNNKNPNKNNDSRSKILQYHSGVITDQYNGKAVAVSQQTSLQTSTS